MKRLRAFLLLAAGCAAMLAPNVSGAAASDPVVVAVDDLGDAPVDREVGGPGAGSAAGIDVKSLAIREPDSTKLEFIVQLGELNVPPPGEVVRYLWMMTVGEAEYWISAKTSDFTTATTLPDDPSGPATHVGMAIRLRGPCTVVGTVRTCRHIMWLEGDFDTQLDQIRVRVPLGNAVAPHFVSGNVVGMNAGAMQAFTASIQAVVSNNATSDVVEGADPYVIP